MTAASDMILEVNNIEVVYNKAIQALRGLSLAVPKGRIVALLGSNGAGKSTVLKAVSALLPMENGLVTEGRILFDGKPVEQSAPHRLVRSGLFHVMEGRRIFADLTVEENLVAATYALSGKPDAKPDFDNVYRYFPRLAERRKNIAGYLSGGEQQMLAIARAMIARPKMILLDEPSEGIMPVLVEEMGTLFRRLRDEGVTLLLVEQNVEWALKLASRAVIIDQGEVVHESSAAALLADKAIQERYCAV